MAVQRVIGGVDIEDDLPGRWLETVEIAVHEEAVHSIRVDRDAPIAVLMDRFLKPPLQTVQRALACQGLAPVRPLASVSAQGIPLADDRGQEWVSPELVVILEASIAQSQAEDSLAQQLLDRVLDLAGVAGVSEAGGKALDDLRSNKAPPSEVMAPPSKAATTWRRPGA